MFLKSKIWQQIPHLDKEFWWPLVRLQILQILERCQVGKFYRFKNLSLPQKFLPRCLIQSRHLGAKSKVYFRSQSSNKIRSWLIPQVENYLLLHQTIKQCLKIFWTNDIISAWDLESLYLDSCLLARTS